MQIELNVNLKEKSFKINFEKCLNFFYLVLIINDIFRILQTPITWYSMNRVESFRYIWCLHGHCSLMHFTQSNSTNKHVTWTLVARSVVVFLTPIVQAICILNTLGRILCKVNPWQDRKKKLLIKLNLTLKT